MIEHKTENPYFLYENRNNKSKRQDMTKKIDDILEKSVKGIIYSIEKAAKDIDGLDGEKLGIGDTLTDEEIIMEFRKLIKDRVDGGKIWEHFYNLIH